MSGRPAEQATETWSGLITEDRIALAERAVVLTVLFEPVVRQLRRLAQEDANHRRHARRACGRGEQTTE
ncbi:hypothetical protein ABZ835_19500 [Streptomyces sp. NPDC047461]|uniref:hypothetical protein n=1 Tax=Streptomyces sp. NPDC047461 TaxID=3155619 RepID=UPI003409A09D